MLYEAVIIIEIVLKMNLLEFRLARPDLYNV